MRELDTHVPRFAQHNLFFYALLGVVSFGRKLKSFDGLIAPDSSPQVRSTRVRTSADHVDYLLLGVHSLSTKVGFLLAELIEDGQRPEAPVRPVPAGKNQGLLR